MPTKKGKSVESLDESLGRKLTFRFKGSGSRQISQFWVRRTMMMYHSKVVREACKKDPELRDFNEPDIDGISEVFPVVKQFVHEDVVPIGPGEVVGCLSREATIYIHQMFRLYRFAVQYEMEDLADRTIDEIQSHEFRCRGYLRMQWILDVYKSTQPGSVLRLYCAASLYHSGIRTFDREFECHRASNFKMVRDEFPEVVDDIKRMAKVFHDRSTFTEGFKIVDHRNQKAFGMCVFHLHSESKVCHVRSRIARQARTWGRGWGNWEMVRSDVPLPTVYPVDNGSDTESDNDPVDEEWEEICGLDDAEAAAAKTTKHTSPEFTDSAISGGEEELDEEMDTTPSPSSSISSADLFRVAPSNGTDNTKELRTAPSSLLGGNVGSGERDKKKKYLLPKSPQHSGGPISNGNPEKKKQLLPRSQVMPADPQAPDSPKNQAEDQLLNELLDSVSKTQAEDDESCDSFKELSFKGLDRYFHKLTPQQYEAQRSGKQHTPTPPEPLPKPALRPHPQVFQRPASVKPEVFGCKTCERTFAHKEDFLRHISRKKKKLCTPVERKRQRSESLDEASLTPLEHIHRRPRLDYRPGD
ncbi:hypothetical protein L207DRAFT_640086 [Hyaloscypha variabilis F]|uniref:Uncharacterized protein n=1 Tax=Hyaloscypha variabilis (strain UAMH 11265 / GT02V1 / F) TaxID=1149755 RepID=A0A2J6R160_HYAVF|nr:hypothetical protein L207DRAFT_640086 [Hyaloscypha variabilis F]